MPLPSKQEMIYSYLLDMFEKDTLKNGRLPSENELAARIGVARRTLRYTLARLENEGFLIRTNHGTFLRKKHRRTEALPVTVLVPCSDYHTASGYWSSFLTHQTILGAMEASVKAGTYAVTLPVTTDNDPTVLDIRQINHLDQESMVIFHGIEWAPGLIPILIERKCRCGIISYYKVDLEKFAKYDIPIFNIYLEEYWECLGSAVEQLVQDGAEKVVYFGRNSTDISKNGKIYFEKACKKLQLECDMKEQYVLFDKNLPHHQLLAQLRDIYNRTHFDGLIFDSNLYYELPGDLDFFGETGIPGRTKMILGVSELLKHPDLPEHTRVLHRPQKKIAGQLAEFLLSGKKGQFSCHCEYEFPLLEEFFRRTERE